VAAFGQTGAHMFGYVSRARTFPAAPDPVNTPDTSCAVVPVASLWRLTEFWARLLCRLTQRRASSALTQVVGAR
jgi:hypothetical protein